MKMNGIPVGGGTLIALSAAIFVWFPEHARQAIDTHVDRAVAEITTQTEFRENLRGSVETYLESEVGVGIVRNEVESAVRRKMPALVSVLLSSRLPMLLGEQLPEQIGELLPVLVASSLPAEVEGFLSSERGDNLLQQLVIDHLNTKNGRELLIEELNKALEPVVEQIGQQIGTNQQAQIIAFSKTLDKLGQFKKGSHFALDSFLRSREAREIMAEGRPIVLTKTIRTGFGYVREAIHEHMDAFRSQFGSAFVGIAIFDEDGRTLVGFVDDQRFSNQLDRDDSLLQLLRSSSDDLTREQAVNRLQTWFGDSAVSFVRADWQIGQALTFRPVWGGSTALDRVVAIVDGDNGQMLAIASRRELVAGLAD
jgi:hypothetical protein